MYNDIAASQTNILLVQEYLPFSKQHLAYYFFNGMFSNKPTIAILIDMVAFCVTAMLLIFFVASLAEVIIPAILGTFRIVRIDPIKDLKYISLQVKKEPLKNRSKLLDVPAHNLAKDGIFKILEIRKIGRIYSVKEYCIFDILAFTDDIEEVGKILADYKTFINYCRPVKTMYVSANLEKHLYITPKLFRSKSTVYPDLRRMKLDDKLEYLKTMLRKSLILIRTPEISNSSKLSTRYFTPVNELTSIRQFKEIIDELYSQTL